jgi:hypothetical protein
MTWGDLEQIVDASDLSLRTHAVLRAYTKYVNPPTDKRPYPENMLVWPSMEAVVDLSRCSRDMVQRAKHELVTKGILELVGHPGRGKTPRYRVNEQKIQRDEAVLERQQQRRARREKGSQEPEPFPQKGSRSCDPFGQKGSQERDLEVILGCNASKETNFFQGVSDPDPEPTPPTEKKSAKPQSPPKAKAPTTAKTSAPEAITITPELEAWRDAEAPGLDLTRAIKKFLTYAKAHGWTNVDWEAAFCFYTLNGQDQQAAVEQQRQASATWREALRVQWQAEAAVELPGGPDAWTGVRPLGDGFYGTHVGGCGEPHQCNGPCPTA